MIKFLSKKKLIILIIALGFLLRLYKLEDFSIFDYDQETAAWAVKGILIDHKPTLIGQEISIGGIYTGPLYYYLLTPFFAVSKMNPLSANIMTTVLSIFTIYSLYYVGNKLFKNNVGLIAAFFYAFSTAAISNDINSVPSNPIILVATWLFYFFIRFFSGEFKYLLPISILFGLVFHFHPSAILLILVFLITWIFKKSTPNNKTIFLSLCCFILLISPLIIFDLRHNFLVTKNISNFLNSGGNQETNLVVKLEDLISIYSKNLGTFFIPNLGVNSLFISLIVFLFLVASAFRESKKKLPSFIFVLWIIIPTISLLFYKGHIPEYYFAISTPILVLIASQKIANLFSRRRISKILTTLFLAAFLIINLNNQLHSYNLLSLRYKKELVSFVVKDSQKNPFNLYIDTDLGYATGYNYLFYYFGVLPQDGPYNIYIITAPYDTRINYEMSKVEKDYPNSNILKYKFGNLGVIKVINKPKT